MRRAELPDTPAGWRKYQKYLGFLAEDEPSKKALAAARMSRGWCIGSPQFRAEIKRELAVRGADLERFAGLEPEDAKAERAASWDEKLITLAGVAKVDLAKLPAQNRISTRCDWQPLSSRAPPFPTGGWPSGWRWENRRRSVSLCEDMR